jgi:hypothetical protein
LSLASPTHNPPVSPSLSSPSASPPSSATKLAAVLARVEADDSSGHWKLRGINISGAYIGAGVITIDILPKDFTPGHIAAIKARYSINVHVNEQSYSAPG